jgi:hypothetical protein
MDIAAAGFAAAQIAGAQRSQQAALWGIRGQQQQSQSVANLLDQAVSAAKQISGAAPQPAPNAAPSSGGGGTPASSGGNPTAQRGSLVNILA